MRFFILGATGNVGLEVIRSLRFHDNVFAGVRNPLKAKSELPNTVKLVTFDFEDTESFLSAFLESDVVFLLRPPHISDVNKFFTPLIDAAVKCRVAHIVFLSVQGVESSSIIPHHKIENLIVASGIPYTFLRPSYFMQNLTTTLLFDIKKYRQIYIPAGRASFNLIDVRDIGEVAAKVLENYKDHSLKAYDITGSKNLSFLEMAEIIRNKCNTDIIYVSPMLLSYLYRKNKEGIPISYVFVMIMLHYIARFQKPPIISDVVLKITGHSPILFEKFVADHADIFRV